MSTPDCDAAFGRLDAASFVATILHRLLTTGAYPRQVSTVPSHNESSTITLSNLFPSAFPTASLMSCAMVFAAHAHDPSLHAQSAPAPTKVPTSCAQLADTDHYSNDLTRPEIKALKTCCDGGEGRRRAQDRGRRQGALKRTARVGLRADP
jgi:hypothetical protein